MSNEMHKTCEEIEVKEGVYEPTYHRNTVDISARITHDGRFECEINADSIEDVKNLMEFIDACSFKCES